MTLDESMLLGYSTETIDFNSDTTGKMYTTCVKERQNALLI